MPGPRPSGGRRGQVKALTLNEGREIPCQAVLFSIGVAPNVEFLAGTDLAGPEGIPVDHQHGHRRPRHLCRRGLRPPLSPPDGKRAGYHIWPAAVAQGRVAGANLAGAGLTYDGLLPQNSLSLRGFHIITGGLGPQDAAGLRDRQRPGRTRGRYRRLVYREGKLVGLTLVGAVEDAGIYFQLMAQQLPVTGPVQPGLMWG